MKNSRKISILFLVLITTAFLHSEEIFPEEKADKKITEPPSAHEIYLAVGYPNSIMPILVGGIQDIFTAIFSGGKQGTKLQSFGVSQIGYNWYCIPGQGFSVGALFTAEPYRTEHHFEETPEKNYSETTTMFTIQATAKYQYGWEFVRLYHGISLGLGLVTMYGSNQSTTPIFAMNIIPIGVKVGREKGMNFIADVGVGTTPVINVGVDYRF